MMKTSMKTFIKVTEIWLPNAQRTQLEFGSGLYGALTEFKAASEQQHFAYDEGLPGKAWAQGHPVMLTAFEHSYFKRTAAAKKAGLTCGIAIPIFSGDFLLAVVMFLCGDDEQHAGAIEVWSNQESDNSLSVLDGYYGTLHHFEQLSRQIKLSKGQGIPGQVWASKMPVLIENIGQPDAFVRGIEAQKAGITTCLGIPIADNGAHTYIMTFLSAKATPLAKRIQIWIPDTQGQHLLCQQGYSKHNNELAQIFETLTVRKGEGALGRVWLTGLPVITGDNEANYNPELDNLSTMLAIPVITHGHLTAIVSFLF
jgi:hypothetical protein